MNELREDKIKILHIGLSDNKGGIENVVRSWNSFKPDSFQFDFIKDTDEELAFEDEFKEKGANIYRVPFRFKNPIERIKVLNSIIENGGYNYIHMHVMDIDDPVPLLLANRNRKCRVIIHCHSFFEGGQTIKENIVLLETKLLTSHIKRINIACSRKSGDAMFAGQEYTVIENGIDTKKYSFSIKNREKIRREFEIKDDEVVIGNVGHVCDDSNYEFLIRTVAEAYRNDNRIKLMLVGNTGEDDGIRKIIRENGLENRTVYTGVVSDTSPYYSAMDVYYIPSIREGFPLALMEAQTSGLPCVISDTITKETKICDNALFTELDDKSMIESLIKAANIKINRNEINIDKRYDSANSADKMFTFYKSHLH